MSCANNDAIFAFLLIYDGFHKGEKNFIKILRQEKRYSARQRNFIMDNDLVYHSIDCCEFKGRLISCTGNLTLEMIVTVFKRLRNYRPYILLKLVQFTLNK